jgi:hypothetical protein
MYLRFVEVNSGSKKPMSKATRLHWLTETRSRSLMAKPMRSLKPRRWHWRLRWCSVTLKPRRSPMVIRPG